jgi:hypothetical protein
MRQPLILLWGVCADGPLATVRSELERQHVDCIFLDQAAIGETEMEISFEGEVSGRLRIGSQETQLGDITAAYLRPYDFRGLTDDQGIGPDEVMLQRGLAIGEALNCWAELSPALIVNRPEAMASNNSKPYQAELIRSVGFAVPDTLVTTDPQAAMSFWKQHGSLIYKSISGVRSIVTRLADHHLDRLEDISHCPTLFQQYIAGTDYRVHVVGQEVFACAIVSAVDDYRYAGRQGAEVVVRPIELPRALLERCQTLARSLGLTVTGIDLRRSDSGEWYCFEANPSPGFTFYEAATDQPIAQAIAKLLADASFRA